MNKLLFTLLFFFALMIYSCQEKEPPKYYAIDGTEHSNLESRIRHEYHIKEMRRLQMDIKLTKEEIIEWERNLIRIKYKNSDELIDLYRSTNFDLYKIEKEYGGKIDTFKAHNSEIFYQEILRDDFNRILRSLDSLNTIIDLQEYNAIK